ncbi:hypothetical protein IGI04_026737 [Brassica rapa subsp. trilocularis]|uniref:Uncharacterized protein n=1 Tax=Brassica rapa subsp. trilocularis TaxID=1813537 RepID=A0ABQ7KZM1_BRACM|nr:hypothetical protein IGI04_026737 [Brassica rapa subsp. trilocularis]
MSLEPDTGPDTKDINQFNSLLPQALRLQVSKYRCMSLFPLLNPYFITRKVMSKRFYLIASHSIQQGASLNYVSMPLYVSSTWTAPD